MEMQLYAFDHPHQVPPRELAGLLGGKGAGLAEMTSGLGMNVPPGFTISLPICREYRATGWPVGLDEAIGAHVARLGQVMGRRFEDPADPLLLAVRSGAPVSMPGMLDTVLNLGLNPRSVEGLAAVSGDERFAWDSYRRFLEMFAVTVMGLPSEVVVPPGSGDVADGDLREHALALRDRIAGIAGRPVPEDPFVQLHEATEAVFRSWDCERARVYRAREGIDESMGTAVNVQAMVFGNRGPDSGTGVVFTRDPATGESRLYGDYLPQAQGEDVVSGTATTLPITELGTHLPAAYQELQRSLRRLEVHYRDMCDVEFTLEDGRLWLLQTRVGKRGAVAAVRIAVELTEDPEIRLTEQEALARTPAAVRERARAEIAAQSKDDGTGAAPAATGLGASPGKVAGAVVFSSDAAADAEGDVILVRRETTPEDVVGMTASVGIVTTRGGLVSHAAVVARGWGIPAVVGASGIEIVDSGARLADGSFLKPGDVVTIDGATGEVWLGDGVSAGEAGADQLEQRLPHLLRLDAWDHARTEVRA